MCFDIVAEKKVKVSNSGCTCKIDFGNLTNQIEFEIMFSIVGILKALGDVSFKLTI